MKEKIVGILVCVLLIATAIPAVTSIKKSEMNPLVVGHPLMSEGMKTSLKLGNEFFTNKERKMIPSYPLPNMVGDTNWTETQKLTIPDAVQEWFGISVSVDGDTALIGAPTDDGLDGSVYVYIRNGSSWTQQQILSASDPPGVDDSFGISVSLNGDTALIGADDEMTGDDSGAAYVFVRTGTTWTQQAKLIPSDGAPNDWFGAWRGVAIQGDTAVIGSRLDDDNGYNSGSAYVFTRTGTTWTQQAKLLASDGKANDVFGWGVSLDGDTTVIGRWSPYNDTNPSYAYVFTRTGTTWTEQAKLIGSDSVPGDSFSYDTSLSGDTAIVGAPNACDNGDYSGSAYAFTRTGSTWTQEAELLPSDGQQYAWFGSAVPVEGNTVLIGAGDDFCPHTGQGSAYIFTRNGTTWTQQQKLKASDGASYDQFGFPACLNGNTAFIAAYYRTTIHGPNTGSVYVFTKPTGNLPPVADFTWTPQNPKPKQPINFDASASHDPDGTITTYGWDWDNDGVFDETYTSPTATHNWDKAGSYPVVLRVTDNDNATDTFTKTVYVNDTIEFTIKISGGFGIKAAITNNGSIIASHIQWTYTLTKGFILFGKTKSGTITSLLPGSSRTVKDSPIFGFGKTIIQVNVTCAEGYKGTQTAVGSVFLFFVGVT
jgi:hypothetical protein